MNRKIRHCPAQRFFGYYPGTVAVITVAVPGGERNVMSAGWHSALSMTPPLYGVAVGPARHTHRLIKAAGCFGVNFLPFDKAHLIAAAGASSGREGDKFEQLGIALEAPIATSAPIIECAYLSYECRVAHIYPVGDHDWFVGEVVAIHHDADSFDERGLFRSGPHQAAVYLVHLHRRSFLWCKEVKAGLAPFSNHSFVDRPRLEEGANPTCNNISCEDALGRSEYVALNGSCTSSPP